MNGNMSSGLALLLVAVVAINCSGNLSKGKAKDLLLKDYEAHGAQCSTRFATDESGRHVVLPHGMRDTEACARGLVEAKFATTSVCAESGSSGECVRRFIEAVSPVRWRDDDLVIPCGKFEAVEVTSVTTEGKKATVKSKRTFRPDEALLKALADCGLVSPEAGDAEITTNFVRNDDGDWVHQP